MSIFASQTQSEPIPIPFDAPHWIVVRKLTGRECDEARAAHATGLAAGGSRLWATKFRRILEGSLADKADVEQAIADPLTGYDRFALVRAGLVSWSYEHAIKDGKPWRLDDLDDEAVDFIATEVLRLTKPALFYTAREDVERAQKERSAVAPVA